MVSQQLHVRPENPDVIYNSNIRNWGPTLCVRPPDVTIATVDAYLRALYCSPSDFVYSVTRDFVRTCQTPAFDILWSVAYALF